MTDAKQRIALLIDADNASAAKIEEILELLKPHGKLEVRRAYGAESHLKPWKAALQAHRIKAVQQVAYGRGKNATDIAMVIGAMELFHRHSVDAFALVSSDADFAPLAMHLKVKGVKVYGFGEAKTPKRCRKAFTAFNLLDGLATTTTSPAPVRDENKLRADTGLHQRLRGAVDATKVESGWADLSKVGKKIREKAPFEQRSYGYRQLGELMSATDCFEVRILNKVGQARYKQAA